MLWTLIRVNKIFQKSTFICFTLCVTYIFPSRLLRRTSLNTTKRNWRNYAPPSSPNYTSRQEVQKACQAVCPEECLVHLAEDLQVVKTTKVEAADQPSKKLIKFWEQILGCVCLNQIIVQIIGNCSCNELVCLFCPVWFTELGKTHTPLWKIYFTGLPQGEWDFQTDWHIE